VKTDISLSRLDYFKSYWSLLSAIPFSSDDTVYSNIMGIRKKHRSTDALEFSLKEIYRDNKKTDVPWITSSYGVYTVIEREIPVSLKRNIYQSHPGVVILFCDKPSSMKSVLSGDLEKTDDIDVLSVHKRDDHLVNGEIAYDRLIEIIKRDNIRLRDDIQSHETFIQEGDTLIRSDSCVIFAEKSKKKINYYNIYQYFHTGGEDGFFMHDKMMQSGLYRNALKLLSVRTNKTLVSKDDLQQTIQETANVAAECIMNHSSPNKIYKGGVNFLRKSFKNIIQPMSYTVSRWHIPTLVAGAVGAAAFSYLFLIAAGLLTTLKVVGISSLLTRAGLTGLFLSNNPIGKVMNGVSRFITKALHNNKLVRYARMHDYKQDFAKNPNFIFNTIWGCKAHKEFFDNIKFTPYADIETATHLPENKLPYHTTNTENQWALMQRCHADCHDGASLISLIQDQETGAIGLKLIDGCGIEHLHIKPHESISYDNGEPSHIFYDLDRCKYFRRQTRHVPNIATVGQVVSVLSNRSAGQLATHETVSILPPKIASRGIKKMRLTPNTDFNSAHNNLSAKSLRPRLWGLVGRGGPARKL